MDKNITPENNWPVIFRKYSPRKGGEVIAVFPYDAASYDPDECGCYVHVGQHGACDPRVVMRDTRPATEAEATPLRRELEGKPYEYRFKVYKRLPPGALAFRKAELAKVR